jgi:hypothetical protein
MNLFADNHLGLANALRNLLKLFGSLIWISRITNIQIGKYHPFIKNVRRRCQTSGVIDVLREQIIWPSAIRVVYGAWGKTETRHVDVLGTLAVLGVVQTLAGNGGIGVSPCCMYIFIGNTTNYDINEINLQTHAIMNRLGWFPTFTYSNTLDTSCCPFYTVALPMSGDPRRW